MSQLRLFILWSFIEKPCNLLIILLFLLFFLYFFDRSVVPAGFIDFIVEPTFSGLIDTAEKVIGPLIEEERQAKESGNRRTRYYYYSLFQKNGRIQEYSSIWFKFDSQSSC